MGLEAIIGKTTVFRKTVSESDVYLFAGITGDFSPNHVDEAFMATTPYKRRIAHGALLVGYMSGSSTDIVAECKEHVVGLQPVSLGYDRIRFLLPVFIADTIEMTYKVTSVDTGKFRSLGDITITNQKNELCAVAQHVMKWLQLNESTLADEQG